MAKILQTFDFDSGSRSKYPWPTWLDGRIWQLEHGDDFQCHPKTMAVQAQKHAKRLGRKVLVKVTSETTLVVQLLPAATTNGHSVTRPRVGPMVGAGTYE